jgi:hypothetical protein
MTSPTGRHRRRKGITLSALELTIMILFGTLGVLMVISAQLLSRPSGRHGRKTA